MESVFFLLRNTSYSSQIKVARNGKTRNNKCAKRHFDIKQQNPRILAAEKERIKEKHRKSSKKKMKEKRA
jgi:hypothetical protein